MTTPEHRVQSANSAPTDTRGLVQRIWPGVSLDDAVPTPEQVLGAASGAAVGDRFLRHDEIVRYSEAVAAASDRVALRTYGASAQGRPLQILTIASPERHRRLDQILEANRRLADPEFAGADEFIADAPVIVWLSFGVHGNEPGPTEAAVRTLYALAAAQGEQADEVFENAIVVIDPCLNPDGRQRYVSWYENTVGADPDPHAQSAEHDEPWPGGRTNHYLFDLNRDWVWGFQPESAARVPTYREYLPHLHIDSHEQGYENPFFFGQGDTPYHANIPESTREWIKLYGRANAEVFDKRGWVYSTAERFDYLYPGYGKVLPVYHGAVGLLTEAAGHSRGGLEIDVHEHNRWTILDRTERHLALSIDYVRTSAEEREGQLKRFRGYFVDSVERGHSEPFAAVISADNAPALLERVWDLCQLHGIEIRRLESAMDGGRLKSYYGGETAEGEKAPEGSWLISAEQPLGLLVRTLFAPDAPLEDADTYDITAWSVPPSFGLDAWYTEQRVRTKSEPIEAWSPAADEDRNAAADGEDVALVIDASSDDFPAAVGAAIRHGLLVRIAGAPTSLSGEAFATGSLIVHVARQSPAAMRAFEDELRGLTLRHRRVGSAMTDDGAALGVNANRVLRPKPVAIVRGSPMGANSFGHHWWMLDREMRFPHSQLYANRLASAPLDEYSAVVLPSGGGLSEGANEALEDWIRGGGLLIASGSSAFRISRDMLELEVEDEDAEPEADTDEHGEQPSHELRFAERRERDVADRVSGALVAVEGDTTHPLMGGAPERVGVVIRSASALPVDDEGYVLARFAEAPTIGGAISEENAASIAGEPFMTLHRVGRGWVVCVAHDVTLRGFLVGGRRLLANVITLGPAF